MILLRPSMSMWEQAERELADESEGQGVQAESVLGFRLPIGFSRAQFRDFCVLMLVLTLLVSGYFMTAPLLVFAQAQFFNNNQPCIGRMQTVDCTAAMADVSSIQATTQLVQSIAAFVLSPVLGRVSDSIGRRWILIGSCAPMWLTNIALWAWAATRGKVSLYPYYVGQCFPFFLSFLAPVYIADIVPASHRAVFFAFQIGIFGVTQIWASHVAGFFTPPNDAPQNTTIGQVADEFHSDMFNVVSLSVIMSSVAMALVVLVLPETLPVDQRKPFDLRNRSELAQAFNTLSQLKVLKRNNVFLRLAATLFFSSMCQSGNYGFLQLYLTRELNFMPDNTVILSEATGTYSLLSSFVIAPLVISAFGEKLTIVFVRDGVDSPFLFTARASFYSVEYIAHVDLWCVISCHFGRASLRLSCTHCCLQRGSYAPRSSSTLSPVYSAFQQ